MTEHVSALAEAAMRAVDTDPERGVPLAREALAAARRARDPAAASVAERAWGHALLHCGTVGDATRHLRRAVAHGRRACSPRLVAEARLKLAYAVLQAGRPRAALREIDTALGALGGASADRFHGTRGIVLYDIGRFEEARAALGTALGMMRAAEDLLAVQRALINRALVHSALHDFPAAGRDLREAEELARRLGRALTVGLVASNLGLMETARGDVPAALAHFDRAEQIIGAHGAQLGTGHQCRSELLLSVGLVAEARDAAAKAVDAYRREGRALKVPEVRLVLSQAALLDGDPATALAQARDARRELRGQRRPERAALARLAELRAWRELPGRPRVSVRDLEALVATLDGAGWPGAAVEARIVASRLAPRQADRLLVQAAAARRRGPVTLRARGWYATALRHRAAGARGATVRAARAGLRLLDGYGAALGATDLRVHAATHRRDLVELGLRTALDGGRASAVFEWAERGRASRLRTVVPPADAELAGMLAELRAVARADSAPGRQAALERRIRDHTRRARGGGGAVVEPVRPRELVLGDTALVEFLHLDGELLALTVVEGRVALRRLGPLATVDDLAARIPFALHRIARTAGPDPARGPLALLGAAAAGLDELLLGPLPEVAGRPLVVVPTGALHSMAWSVLPSCRGREVSVCPSATLWQEAALREAGAATDTGTVTGTVAGTATDTVTGTVAVAGPGLAGARDEAAAVAALHAGALLAGDAATAPAVLAALAGAGLVHLAAHGRLAVGNALFSDLLLADGPLMVHDIERLPRVPRTVVLAACEGGRSQVCAGDELLGLAAAFLARGSARLVAPVVAVPDARTAPAMIALHRRLAAGEGPAAALAAVQADPGGDDPRDAAAAAGFVCLGSGAG
ncbi:MAG: CHAT domain-containing protein [Pseudonocardia sp.]